jgi:hypothetical protein
VLSRKAENGEANLSELSTETFSLAEEVVWAIDQPGRRGASLLVWLP